MSNSSTPTPTAESVRRDIATLREMLAKATPGPWESYTNYSCPGELKGAFIVGQVHIADVSARKVNSQDVAEANSNIMADARATKERALAAAEEAMALYDKQVEFNKSTILGEGFRERCEAEDMFLKRANAALLIALGETVKENDE